MMIKTVYENMIEVGNNFHRDFIRKKYRNCVLILFQNRYVLSIQQFVFLFETLVENSPCIDYVKSWDLNSQYKYYQLLDFYHYVLESFKDSQPYKAR